MDILFLNANSGCPIAQCELGFYYYRTGNINESIKWYDLSARQGFMVSQRSLGFIYLDCIGDINEAIKFFSFSALRNDYVSQCKLKEINGSKASPNAKCQLGFFYYKIGNYGEAIRWYLDSAEQGCTDANYDLAHLYLKGIGVEQDTIEARDHFLVSAKNNRVDAQYNVGLIYLDKLKDMTLAYKWLKRATNGGHPDAKEKLQYFKNIRMTIKTDLHRYDAKNTGEGISYLFFCNFLKFLSNDLKGLDDPLISSWITKYLTKYFIKLDRDFDSSLIQTWFDAVY